MKCSIVENGDGPGPFGAKGCGEGALAAIPAAIVNALADADVPMNTLPLTPERVWRRIQDLGIELKPGGSAGERFEGRGGDRCRHHGSRHGGGPGPGRSQVRLYDITEEVLDRARGACAAGEPGPGSDGGRASARRVGRAFELDLGQALTRAGLVLETIPEDLDLKREVLAAMEGHLEPDAIIATNTSGIPVSSIASALQHRPASSACTGPTRRTWSR